jgi:transcriptional regulator
MYQPRHFAQHDPAALRALMAAHPLATLVHAGGGDGFTADHVPLIFEPAPEGAAHAGVLKGHVARANPLWRQAAGQRVLAVFNGPQAYVSPGWYPSKADTHKVVPTWNYAVVHAHGTLEAHDDPAWLHAFVTTLTQAHEAGRTPPWAVSDAPADYVQQMLRAIVGIQITVTALEGKWKVSQNRGTEDRAGVADGVEAESPAMAALVRNPPTENVR